MDIDDSPRQKEGRYHSQSFLTMTHIFAWVKFLKYHRFHRCVLCHQNSSRTLTNKLNLFEPSAKKELEDEHAPTIK